MCIHICKDRTKCVNVVNNVNKKIINIPYVQEENKNISLAQRDKSCYRNLFLNFSVLFLLFLTVQPYQIVGNKNAK